MRVTEVKHNALWDIHTQNISIMIKIHWYAILTSSTLLLLPIVFPSSQLLHEFAWLNMSQDDSLSKNYGKCEPFQRIYTIYYGRTGCSRASWPVCLQQIAIACDN